ncbi:sulfatase-like hydrolase/transferase [Coraliomargarita sp. W4R53]
MIFTDDHRYDAVGFNGNHSVTTPQLDKLARDGIIFSNAFVNTSICATSRANLISGQYPSRHGVDDFFKKFTPKQLDDSIPGRLQRAGYQTAFFGKWGIGDTPDATHEGAAAFDYWAGQPMQTCYFHEADCKYVNFNGFKRPLDDLCDCPADAKNNVGFRNRIGIANLKRPIQTDSTVIPNQVKRFLAGRDTNQPFAMMLFFKGPHSPYEDWDPEVKHVTDGLVMPIPSGATIENALREPSVIKTSLGAPTGMHYLKNPQALDTHLRHYYRLVSSLDLGIGRIMDSLKEQGLADNTVILFTADNGHFKGEHGLAGKWLMYEAGHRVPGFIYDPRKNGGRVSLDKVITTDFSATMLALAGLEVPSSISGENLMVEYDDVSKQPLWRDAVYHEHPYSHGGRIPPSVGIRESQYVYIRYTEEDPVFEQIFDTYADPNELNNLATNPEYAGLLKRLRNRCDAMHKSVGKQ